MLVNFSVQNWMSFKEEASLSMVASLERQRREDLPELPKHKLKVLPISAIYGGNASGKSNLCKAIAFMRSLITEQRNVDDRIPVHPFKLDRSLANEPSVFSMEFSVNDEVFELTIKLDSTTVIEERLVKVLKTSDRVLYSRYDCDQIEFHSTISDNKRLSTVFDFTRSNEVFLQKSVSLNCTEFRAIYDWFLRSLLVLTPDSKQGLLDTVWNNDAFDCEEVGQVLSQLDTGVSGLGLEEVKGAELPKRLRDKIEADFASEDAALGEMINRMPYERLFASKRDDEITYHRLVSYHRGKNQEDVQFELSEESDGTQRLFDLIAVFLKKPRRNQSELVLIIDELDRSLHTLLSRSLIQYFLRSSNPSSRRQMILTTHDVMLMDQELLRRDQMWVTERNHWGESRLYSFSEFKDVRKDKHLRRSYLSGRLGGIPKMFLAHCNEPDLEVVTDS